MYLSHAPPGRIRPQKAPHRAFLVHLGNTALIEALRRRPVTGLAFGDFSVLADQRWLLLQMEKLGIFVPNISTVLQVQHSHLPHRFQVGSSFIQAFVTGTKKTNRLFQLGPFATAAGSSAPLSCPPGTFNNSQGADPSIDVMIILALHPNSATALKVGEFRRHCGCGKLQDAECYSACNFVDAWMLLLRSRIVSSVHRRVHVLGRKTEALCERRLLPFWQSH